MHVGNEKGKRKGGGGAARRTTAGGGKKGRDPTAGGANALGEGALGTQLDGDLAGQVLALELLVRAEEGHDDAVDLAGLGEEGEPAAALGAGIVGDAGERVQGVGAAAAESLNQGRWFGCWSVVGWWDGMGWSTWVGEGDRPATPHSPNPELRMTEPLWMSATASSAEANSLESARVRRGALEALEARPWAEQEKARDGLAGAVNLDLDGLGGARPGHCRGGVVANVAHDGGRRDARPRRRVVSGGAGDDDGLWRMARDTAAIALSRLVCLPPWLSWHRCVWGLEKGWLG